MTTTTARGRSQRATGSPQTDHAPAATSKTTGKPILSQSRTAQNQDAAVTRKPARTNRAAARTRADGPATTTTTKATPGKAGKPAAKSAPDTAQGGNGKTAAAYQREVDHAIIQAAGDLVERVPSEHRAAVAAAIANQLHHLSTPKLGWPTDKLPKPARSDWR